MNHNNAHWTAAAINFRKKRIESYDSMGMDRGQVFKVLRQYLDEEHRNKKKKPFDFTGWKDYTLPVRLLHTTAPACPVLTRFCAGYPATRERLRLRCLHLPVPRGVIPRRRGIRVHPRQHVLPPSEDGLGDRTCQASGRAIVSDSIHILWTFSCPSPSCFGIILICVYLTGAYHILRPQ